MRHDFGDEFLVLVCCRMAEITPVQAQIWKRDTLVLGGNVGLGVGSGGGTVTMVLRRQLSPISSAEVFAMIGQYSVLRVQTSRC